MSSKKNNWATLANFSRYRYEVNERSHFLTKNREVNPFVVKSLLEANCRRFRQSAIRENFNLKPETQLKKNSFQQRRQLYPSIQWSKRESVTSFLHLCQSYLSTRSRTCMHLKKSKIFSSLRRSKPQFRHAQGLQRACALTGSTNNFQSTINTVYEVIHQKTVNTKLGKQTLWLSEVIKEFYHYFQIK